MRNKKGLASGEFLYYMLLIILGFSLLAGIYMIVANTTSGITTGQEIKLAKMRTITTYSKILSSKNALSTGEMGILSEKKLEENDGKPYIDEIYSPSMKYFMHIDVYEYNGNYDKEDTYESRIKHGFEPKEFEVVNEYNIGDDFRNDFGCNTEKNLIVGIEDEDGNIKSGHLYLCFLSKPNPLFYLTEGIQAAHETGEKYNMAFGVNTNANIYIEDGNKLCMQMIGKDYEDKYPTVCKSLKDVELDPVILVKDNTRDVSYKIDTDAGEKYQLSSSRIKVDFIKMPENVKIKITEMLARNNG